MECRQQLHRRHNQVSQVHLRPLEVPSCEHRRDRTCIWSLFFSLHIEGILPIQDG